MRCCRFVVRMERRKAPPPSRWPSRSTPRWPRCTDLFASCCSPFLNSAGTTSTGSDGELFICPWSWPGQSASLSRATKMSSGTLKVTKDVTSERIDRRSALLEPLDRRDPRGPACRSNARERRSDDEHGRRDGNRRHVGRRRLEENRLQQST